MIEWTRVRLTQWGRYCRGGSRTGYPTQSSFMNAQSGGRCEYATEDMPLEIKEVEDCVNRMSISLRLPILLYYVHTGPLWLKSVRAGISKRTFLRRVRSAEEWIDRQLAS